MDPSTIVEPQPQPPASTVYSTPTGTAIAQAVAQHWPALGPVEGCHLLRRGFNDVYAVQFKAGGQRVARLSARRARGPANVDYEAGLLSHLQRAGASVAASLRTCAGASAGELAAPEGMRTLMLFDFLPGEPPGDVLADIEATGRDLARIHVASQHYSGPPSLYALALPHLLDQPLRWLLAAPTLDAGLRADFTAIGERLRARIDGLARLPEGACHGDAHAGNMHLADDPAGGRVASFFDFDDAGPGCLAYDLATWLWSLLLRAGPAGPDAAALERWRRFLHGYQSVREIDAQEFDAIARFVPVRHTWFMGEYASRMAEWGTQTMPSSWLRKQVDQMIAWESLQTPA
ncbi:phosphotransferase [Variovorax sp. dw_954]|uniref:phosphotransferase enzyme family protein n=1 Tax=Variovorax sp. dw_954 TaxID=2720078 RepID=UPI001BD4915D|nr:phosphotransferase [Variovorax sp. dw_954]